MKKHIIEWLSHPLTKGLDIDDPANTVLRRDVIRSKPFLKKIYEDWYHSFVTEFEDGDKVLEIGSGAGFLKEKMPGLITSDIMPLPGIDLTIDARHLPFEDESLDGILMVNVFHHIPDVGRFLSEAERTLRGHGKVIMIEPWNNRWASFIYRNLHHEPFDRTTRDWVLPGTGPLSDANGALPWIVFQRDASIFKKQFPSLSLRSIRPMMPISYVLSGGMSLRVSVPGWCYEPLRRLESLTGESRTGMFAEIRIEKGA